MSFCGCIECQMIAIAGKLKATKVFPDRMEVSFLLFPCRNMSVCNIFYKAGTTGICPKWTWNDVFLYPFRMNSTFRYIKHTWNTVFVYRKTIFAGNPHINHTRNMQSHLIKYPKHRNRQQDIVMNHVSGIYNIQDMCFQINTNPDSYLPPYKRTADEVSRTVSRKFRRTGQWNAAIPETTLQRHPYKQAIQHFR